MKLTRKKLLGIIALLVIIVAAWLFWPGGRYSVAEIEALSQKEWTHQQLVDLLGPPIFQVGMPTEPFFYREWMLRDGYAFSIHEGGLLLTSKETAWDNAKRRLYRRMGWAVSMPTTLVVPLPWPVGK